MTQPQDKMRAEFEAWYICRARSRIAKRLADWSDDEIRSGCMCPQSDGSYGIQSADDGWISWQAACAQQSAQSQQDALDATRYRWLARKVGAHGVIDGWAFSFPTHLTIPAPPIAMYDPERALGESIDALIAAQGASNV